MFISSLIHPPLLYLDSRSRTLHHSMTKLMTSVAVMSQVGNARLIKELINAYFVDVYPARSPPSSIVRPL